MARLVSLLRLFAIAVLMAFGSAWFAAPASAHGSAPVEVAASLNAVGESHATLAYCDALHGSADQPDCPCCPPGGMAHCHHVGSMLASPAVVSAPVVTAATAGLIAGPASGIRFDLRHGLNRPPAI